jgi:predicted DNA-binding transcriptional regulator AlpA
MPPGPKKRGSQAREFPQPIKIGDGRFARNFFRYGEVVAFIDDRAGKPIRDLPETDKVRLITARETRHLLGDVSEMFIWRLLHKKESAAASASQRKGLSVA